MELQTSSDRCLFSTCLNSRRTCRRHRLALRVRCEQRRSKLYFGTEIYEGRSIRLLERGQPSHLVLKSRPLKIQHMPLSRTSFSGVFLGCHQGGLYVQKGSYLAQPSSELRGADNVLCTITAEKANTTTLQSVTHVFSFEVQPT